MKKAYVCNRLPFLKIAVGGGRMVAFEGGLFETEDPDEIAAVERAMNANPIFHRDLPEEDNVELSEVEPPPDSPDSIEKVEEGVTVGGRGTESMKGLRT